MTTDELRESLLMKPTNGYTSLTAEQRTEMEGYSKRYMAFMDACKTEREATAWAVREAEKLGFKPFVSGMEVKPGDKIYYNNRDKSIALAVIGTEPLSKGANICAAHVDSPGWTSSPIPCMRMPRSPTSRPITTAASRSTSGPPCPWRFTAWSTARTAPWSPSPSARTTATPC